MGPAYIAIASLYIVATVLTLCVVAPSKPHPVDETGGGALLRSPMRDLKKASLCLELTANARSDLDCISRQPHRLSPDNGLLPYIAREIYGTNQTGLGYLSASFAVGSLIGSIALSLISGLRVARMMISATIMWYAALLVFAQVQSVPVAMACLMLAGFAQSLCMISLAVILMRAASEHFRGRVMGVRMLVIYSLPLGLLAAGSLIGEIALPPPPHSTPPPGSR